MNVSKIILRIFLIIRFPRSFIKRMFEFVLNKKWKINNFVNFCKAKCTDSPKFFPAKKAAVRTPKTPSLSILTRNCSSGYGHITFNREILTANSIS